MKMVEIEATSLRVSSDIRSVTERLEGEIKSRNNSEKEKQKELELFFSRIGEQLRRTENDLVNLIDDKFSRNQNDIQDVNQTVDKLGRTVRNLEEEEDEAMRAVSAAVGNSTEMQASTRSRRQLREDVEILKLQVADFERVLRKPAVMQKGDSSADPF